MKIFSGTLECKVQPKQRPRVFRGHGYTPKETRDFEKLVSGWAKKLYKKKPSDKPLKVVIDMYFERAKSNKKKAHTQTPDVDNAAKGILDSLNEIVWADDKQIVEIQLNKYFADYVSPSFSIVVYELN